ncbi:zinc-dependent metalloprotease [Rhodohalobacter halophilus]|uniref:zinc-dependent metalloprotease n=1 Tax=Rhodohalobacter halophilus TaxID=1812810 RepID=UPI00083F5673|nr:zinc-dependent metalloprotease [Rhodohalobacter halophilus]
MRSLNFLKITILPVMLFIAIGCATTQPTAPASSNGAQQESASDFDKAIEKSMAYEGLFTIYQDTTDGSTKMAIHKDQLGKEYIYFGMSQDGVLEAGHFRGSFRDNKIVKVRRYFDKVEFVHVNNRYWFDEESPLSRASNANISDALLFSGKISAEDDSSGMLLIDTDPLFLTESLHQIKPSPSPFGGPGQFSIGNLSRDKSKYTAIKNYPKNFDVIVEYVYETPYPTGSTSEAVTDGRSVKITFQHSFIEMPENDFQPRYADPRVGYFTTQMDDQVSTSATPYRDLVHRWNLVKKDPDAEISEPVEPIVWWIENTTPYEFRETIKEATLAWNEAFEAAGFRNAIEVKVQPDDADWDAGDIRYNVLRWTSSPIPPFGGYGPSFVNPRTGQILGADIMLEWGFFRNRSFEEDVLTSGRISDVNVYEAMDEKFCSFGTHFTQNNQFGMSALSLLDAPDEELEGFQKEAMTMLILHELGHTFGLNHNMQASTLHSPEDIHNEELANTIGLTGSVMDYSSVNVNRDRDNQGRYYDIKPGPYDIWAIEFGYKPELDDEAERKTHLNRSTEPELAFGNDADDMRSPGKAIDPRIMVGDMSSDPVAYGVERIEMSRELMNGLLEKFGTREGQSYQELRNAFMSLMGQQRTQTGVISRQIGGVYRDRAFIGQEGGDVPFRPVPAEKQKEAMTYLNQYLFAPDAFSRSHEVYNYLQIQRRGFNFFSMSEDPKIHDMVLSMQGNVLNHLLHPNTAKRITDSRTYGNSYSLADVVGDLTSSIFDADARGNVNTFRQNLQVDYVNRLIAILDSDSYDHISKSTALYNLQNIRNMMDSKGSVNAETRAHAAHIKTVIDKALES